MNKSSYVDPDFDIEFDKVSGKYASYSQFAQYSRCPLSWKLSYIDGLRIKDASIHTIFGDSMHTVIQTWLKVMYTTTIKASNELDFGKMLMSEMRDNYLKSAGMLGDNVITKEELTDFYVDGLATLEWLRKHRTNYFDVKNERLVGTEVPLQVEVDGAVFVAYLDVVIESKVNKKIRIIDLKTSKLGWNDYNKDDEIKTDQVRLYKHFYSKQYGVDDVDVEFIILKRKINEQSEFPIPRVQRFKPPSGKIKQAQTMKRFDDFIKTCFSQDGTYNATSQYPALSGFSCRNCTFCQYKDKHDLCPPEQRRS